ncbi:MAG: HAMP domain-containing protein [Desulfobulbaceae bacterium]|nr:HAMP domain-containing protein [Desulfobulbaceae bacterium]
MKLWVKIFLLNLLIVLCLGMMVGGTIRGVVIDSMREEFSRQGTSIVKNFADRITVSIIVGNRYDIEEAAREVINTENDIVYIYITDITGKIIFHTFDNGYPPDLLQWNPIAHSETPTSRLLDTEVGLVRDIGLAVVSGMPSELHVGLSERRLTTTLSKIRTVILLVMALVIIIGGVLSLTLSRRVTRPLEDLVAFTQSLSRGEFGQQVVVHSKDEIGLLSNTFNDLSKMLKIYRDNKEEHYRQMLQTEKLTALGRLSAGLAHEIRNPLTSIKSLFQAFQEKPEVTRQDIKIVLAAVNQMDELVTKFLGFARTESFRPGIVYPNALLKQIAYLTQFQIKQNDIEVVYHLDKHIHVQGDISMLRQALLNLVMNAIESMPEGGILALGTRKLNDHVEISIQDSGKGIDEGIRDIIFDPFFTTKDEGTGLGLGIVYNIAQLHNGTVSFVSSNNITTFTIKLPITDENDTGC